MSTTKAVTFNVEFPRRQAMLSVYKEYKPVYPWQDITIIDDYMQNLKTIDRVPVLVWPMPTQDGYFVVEHQDGHCQKVQPYKLTFLDSREIFDQYSWETQNEENL